MDPVEAWVDSLFVDTGSPVSEPAYDLPTPEACGINPTLPPFIPILESKSELMSELTSELTRICGVSECKNLRYRTYNFCKPHHLSVPNTRKCERCDRSAIYGSHLDYIPKTCGFHKEKSEVCLHPLKCTDEMCQRAAVFGLPKKNPERCFDHRNSDMIDVARVGWYLRRCQKKGINRKRKYGED